MTPFLALEDGKYRVDVVAYDIQGMYEIKRIWVRVKNELPVVIATDPADGTEEVDIYKKIEIVFNKTMDTASVNQALEIINIDNDSSEIEIKEIEWQNDDETMLITVYDPVIGDKDTVGFDFYTNYEVKILGTAEGWQEGMNG